MIRRIACLSAIALILIGSVSSQDTTGEDLLRQSREYADLAEQALENEDFDEAIRLSDLSKDASQMAIDYVNNETNRFIATDLRTQAEQRIRLAQLMDGSQDVLDIANDFFLDGVNHFNQGDYLVSQSAFRGALSVLEGISIAFDAPLPQYYTVRYIPGRTDSLSRIAGYDFVYGDAKQWPHIFAANVAKLKDPLNPDLILPGQVFIIPSLYGEERSGTWKP